MTQIALATAFMSYLIGSFPTAFLFGKKFLNQDIRNLGTRNLGAYNVFRSVGWIQGAVTLLIDALKGYIPVMVAIMLELNYFWIGACASLALIGHNWSIFTRFKGGKGGSTSAGILFALFPKQFPIIFIFFLILLALTKNLSFVIGMSILIFPFIVLVGTESTKLVAISFIIPAIGLIRLAPFIRRMFKVSEGSLKKMLFIILKGFNQYEQICAKEKKTDSQLQVK